jgi:hypothetical protein
MRSLRSLPSCEAELLEPMECLAVTKLPDGPEWVYETKLDGYRALAINADGKLSLYSRNRISFNRQYQESGGSADVLFESGWPPISRHLVFRSRLPLRSCAIPHRKLRYNSNQSAQMMNQGPLCR